LPLGPPRVIPETIPDVTPALPAAVKRDPSTGPCRADVAVQFSSFCAIFDDNGKSMGAAAARRQRPPGGSELVSGPRRSLRLYDQRLKSLKSLVSRRKGRYNGRLINETTSHP